MHPTGTTRSHHIVNPDSSEITNLHTGHSSKDRTYHFSECVGLIEPDSCYERQHHCGNQNQDLKFLPQHGSG